MITEQWAIHRQRLPTSICIPKTITLALLSDLSSCTSCKIQSIILVSLIKNTKLSWKPSKTSKFRKSHPWRTISRIRIQKGQRIRIGNLDLGRPKLSPTKETNEEIFMFQGSSISWRLHLEQNVLCSSVVDPWHFGADPDPAFSSVADEMPTK